MARVTVEDCLAQVPNRFALTVLAARRARMLEEGRGRPMVKCENKEGVTALREVAAGRVRFNEDVKGVMIDFIEESRRQLRVTTGDNTYLEVASLRALEDDEEGVDIGDDVEELPVDPEAISLTAKSRGEDDSSADSDGDDDEVDDDDDSATEPPDSNDLSPDVGDGDGDGDGDDDDDDDDD